MKLLSIETSCDETALSIFEFEENQEFATGVKFSVLANHVLSQINLHRPFGGVFPTLAKREHAKNIVKIFTECLKEADLYKEEKSDLTENKISEVKTLLERESETFAELIELAKNIKKPEINAIAVTIGPGLAPALWVGVNFAKALSVLFNLQVYPINHMEGHIVSALVKPLENHQYLLENFETPALALLISGGHTEIIKFSELGKYQKIGKILDDAIGEAFDKVARSLSLPYPGGPEISKIANQERLEKRTIAKVDQLTRPMLNSQDLDFSFSGIKTAVIYKIQKLHEAGLEKSDITKTVALDFENAVTEILIKKIKKAISQTGAKSLLVGGGVIANTYIRENLLRLSEQEDFTLYLPPKFLTGDNAFMIGLVAILQILSGRASADLRDILANSNFSVENI